MSSTSNKARSGTPKSTHHDDGFLVIGLGASAGGIQALKQFFAAVPANSGMAYVVILHLSPDHDSQLAEVLQNEASIPVTQVTEQVRVQPNHVYVIPPNKNLAMKDGHLEISNMTSTAMRRAPVDIFFRTLAESHRERAVSVVLSGTGGNGSMGIKRIKERGGLCIVQDPQEAEYTDMPNHSLATGLVDYILPAAEIPKRIMAYRDQLKVLPVTPAEPELQRQTEADEAALTDILTQLRVRTAHDFSNYKRATVLRRIARRMGVHELSDLAAYSQFMHERPQEANALLKDLLISVTNFFRDAAAFEALRREVIPKLFADKTVDDQVRVWVAGCATGEEAYSVAMLLADYSLNFSAPPQIQVFATDIDETAVAAARHGIYTLNDAADIPPELLSRYFVKESDDHFRVRREIRERVLFAVHNVIKDPPFSHLDLVTCRNLLIYLNPKAQKRVMEVLHFALNPGGYLMLGSSESVDGAGDLYAAVDKEHRIYQGRAVETRLVFPVPDGSLALRLAKLPELGRVKEMRPTTVSSYSVLHQRLLERYAPPSVVVNEDYEIVHMSETAGRYMEIKGGEPSANLLMLIRPELRLELRGALYQATQKRTDVESRGVRVGVGEEAKNINIIIKPVLSDEDKARGFILVAFEEGDADPLLTGAPVSRVQASEDEPLARQLEEELIEVKAHLSATIEQHELQREELKASNEELQAMNEEMRSAAEELETSKEELQSINEELTTVNQELKVKIEELGHTNDDFRNLINSSQVGTVFLDRNLRVTLFTPRSREIFNFISADVGRPISDITSKLEDRNLIADAEMVLEHLRVVEREARSTDGRVYFLQLAPYRTMDERIDGVVLSFVDMTERHRAEQHIRKSEEQFRRAIEEAPIPVIMHAEDGEVLQISRTWTELTGYTTEEMKTFDSWLTRAYGEGADEVREHMHELFHGNRKSLNVEFPIRTRNNETRRWSFSASSPGTLRDGRRFIVGMAVDITDRDRVEKSFREADQRFRLLVESAADYAIFTITPDNIIDSWNAGATAVFGWTEAEALGKSAEMIFTPEDREAGVPEQEMATALKKGRAPDERWHLRKDGSRFYVSGVMHVLRDADGKLQGFAKIARDMSAQRRSAEELRSAREELETKVRERTLELAQVNDSLRGEISQRIQVEKSRVRLLRQIVRAQEDERRRIARDIHDHLGQQITALRLNLEAMAAAQATAPEARENFEQTTSLAERLDADVDFLAWELRPAALDDLGLAESVSHFVNEWSKYSGIEAQFHTSGLDKDRLPLETETNLYRITQEALNNIMKHSSAKHVDVLLERRNEHVVLIVEDDGIGFTPKNILGGDGDKGMGLIGMRERAVLAGGALEIESKPKEGTTIFARVPITLDEDAAETK